MPKLLITLPVLNESYVLKKNVQELHAWCEQKFSDIDWEIIIADNGSTDDTFARAKELAVTLPRVSVFHADERGRGQVLRKVWTSHDADWYTYMDADLATTLDSYFELVRALRKGHALVAGSRFHEQARVERSMIREIMSRVYNILARAGLGLSVQDLQCGCKGVSRMVVKQIVPKTKDNEWFFDTELLALATHEGFSVHEVPVEWVETRDKKRKSTVRIIDTSLKYVRDIWRLRKRLSRRY